MSPNTNYQEVERGLLQAVQQVFETYKQRLSYDELRVGTHLGLSNPKPTSRLRLTDNNLAVVIRYPVEISSAADIDDRITRALLETISQWPGVRLVPSAAPALQSVDHEPA
jgi:hypothetical protein